MKLVARYEASEGLMIPTTHYVMWSKVRDNNGSLRFDMIFNLHFIKKMIKGWMNPETFIPEDTLCWKRYKITIRKVPTIKKHQMFTHNVWAKVEMK